MTNDEIYQRISQLEGEIAAAEQRIMEAEKNIRQLTLLRTSCNGYQEEVGYSKDKRKRNREDFMGILDQDNLVDAYGYILKEILDGAVYNNAYQHIDEVKAEIEREIERQNMIISNCRSEMSRLNSSIDSLRQELEN